MGAPSEDTLGGGGEEEEEKSPILVGKYEAIFGWFQAFSSQFLYACQ